MAAPLTPIAGIGPSPNIKIGSSIILLISPTTLNLKGVLLSPVPL